MKPLKLAYQHMDIVFNSQDWRKLAEICAADLRFEGPLVQFTSLNDYLRSMISDPPENFEYRIIKTYEDEDSACLIYDFKKGPVSTTMSQLFVVRNGKISRIKLIFDSKAFF